MYQSPGDLISIQRDDLIEDYALPTRHIVQFIKLTHVRFNNKMFIYNRFEANIIIILENKKLFRYGTVRNTFI